MSCADGVEGRIQWYKRESLEKMLDWAAEDEEDG